MENKILVTGGYGLVGTEFAKKITDIKGDFNHCCN